MGNGSGIPQYLDPDHEAAFPGLNKSGYRVTSAKDPAYNCVAFAAGDTTRKWSPTLIPVPGYYWPPGAGQGDEPDALRSCFEQIGYELCTDGLPEVGFEKVALYEDDDGMWSHAAKLQENGTWSSKLGEIEDIQHDSEHCFAKSIYGRGLLHATQEISKATWLSKQFLDHPPFGNERQRAAETVVKQRFGIDAQQVIDRGQNVLGRDGVIDHVAAVLVGAADDGALANAAACEQSAVGPRPVFSTAAA